MFVNSSAERLTISKGLEIKDINLDTVKFQLTYAF